MAMKQDGLWLEFFLTPTEKDNFAAWKEVVHDRSVISPMFSPIFEWIAQFVPEQVAPNVLTLAGSFTCLQAWYFCRTYAESDSKVVSAVSIVSIVAFWCLGAIDGKHASRTWNDTSLGELFKYCCDLVSSVFLMIVLCELSMTHDFEDQWYFVQTVEMVLFLKHWSAFKREAGLRYLLIGPGELISWAILVLLICCFAGSRWLKDVAAYAWTVFAVPFVERLRVQGLPFVGPSLEEGGYLATMTAGRAAYICVFVTAIVRISISRRMRRRHLWTYLSILFILSLRAGSYVFGHFLLTTNKVTERDVVLDGLFMALITSDLIVAKMANRELHSLIVIMAVSVVLPHVDFLMLCIIAFYYITVFGDLMNHMNLPLLQRCRNVYCDGIYDLCHVGHKNLFRKALTHGNRLFVGVVGDKDANAYKRPPIMSASERESEVRSCKCVTTVIPDAPCFGLTEDFIRKHRIHVVCFGQEYQEKYPNPDDDPYYRVPRNMKIAIPMPRTPGLSTSDLINRIQSRDTDEKKPQPEAKRRKTDGASQSGAASESAA